MSFTDPLNQLKGKAPAYMDQALGLASACYEMMMLSDDDDDDDDDDAMT